MDSKIEKHRDMAAVFNSLFLSPEGQTVIKHLKSRFHISTTTFTNIDDGLGAGDPAITFREGQRSVVLYIDDLINFDFEEADRLLEAEQEEEEKQDDFAT